MKNYLIFTAIFVISACSSEKSKESNLRTEAQDEVIQPETEEGLTDVAVVDLIGLSGENLADDAAKAGEDAGNVDPGAPVDGVQEKVFEPYPPGSVFQCDGTWTAGSSCSSYAAFRQKCENSCPAGTNAKVTIVGKTTCTQCKDAAGNPNVQPIAEVLALGGAACGAGQEQESVEVEVGVVTCH